MSLLRDLPAPLVPPTPTITCTTIISSSGQQPAATRARRLFLDDLTICGRCAMYRICVRVSTSTALLATHATCDTACGWYPTFGLETTPVSVLYRTS